ncbi:hypothetical protein [Streptomyces platensis]|uniref:hypothetical protein n=1 Tax=Streptomyces platensis TaxID=58346 RepID=UPI002E2582E7
MGVHVSRNDFMTALLDSRRALSEEISSVGQRLDDSRREVLDAITMEVESLRNDARETRDRTNHAATAVGETSRAVAALHQEVSDITNALATLQTTLDALAGHPVFQTPEPTSPPADDPEPAVQSEPHSPAVATGEGHTPVAAGEGHTPLAPETGAPPTNSPEPSHETGAQRISDGDADAERLRREAREKSDHGALLLTAAVTGRVALICHREAWDFLAACASENEHFCKTTEVCDEGEGRIRAVLSGRSVIGLLIALRNTHSASSMDGTWALASAFYRRLAEDLTTTSRHGTQPLTVIFDDGIHDHAPVTETSA